MNPLNIKDNTRTPKEKFADVPLITRKIADKTLKQLEREGIFIFPGILRESEDIAADQMVLQSVNDCYCSGNVMGFLGCGKERLVIASRFSTSRHDYFFQYLLERVLDFPNIINLDTDADRKNQLYQLFLFLFPQYLKAAVRKGPFKTYIHTQYNDHHRTTKLDFVIGAA